jgi:pimeloyl-ACP methyl ester carboxylesterase
MDSLFVDTPRLRTHCWVAGPEHGERLLLVHGNITTGRFFGSLAEQLQDRFRIVAPDLRAFGRTEALPVDATRGLRDWSDDLHALIASLGWAERPFHAGGWSMGGAILMQYEIDHPRSFSTLSLLAPMSPYGFGGTRDAQGTPAYEDFAGSGGGTAAPDFVRRLAAHDDLADDPASSPRVVMRSFFWSPRHVAPDEDELIAEVLLTQVGEDFYPGGSVPSENWPGVGPATGGVNNAISPQWCDTSAFGDVDRPAPILWIRGDEDQVVSDASMFDFGTLGKLGAVPGWPGDEVFPSQPMIAQTRAVFSRREAHGGMLRAVVLPEVGHGPPIERPAEVAALMREHLSAPR